jgi:hypothetical protein
MLAEATQTATNARAQVVAAVQNAAAKTGADFDYLLGTAMRESGLKPQAKSGTSSASGLYQFVEQTWLGLVKKYGAEYGLGAAANAISQGRDGRYRADSQSDRQAILALRNDPKAASLMAGKYAQETRATLENTLGRPVCDGELYAAHFLGADGACKLIQLRDANPAASAAGAFPQAAGANRSVFYNADGSAKSVSQVYAWATRQSPSANLAELAATRRLNLRQSLDGRDAAPVSVAALAPVSAPTAASAVGGNDSTTLAATMLAASAPLPSPLLSLGRTSLSLTPGIVAVLSGLGDPREEEEEARKAA